MKTILSIIIIAIVFSSCQKHLKREDAKSQITSHDGVVYFPTKKTYEIVKGFIKDMHTEGRGVTAVIGDDEFKPKEENIYKYKDLGLLSIEETPQREETTQFLFGTTVRTWTSVKVSLTDKGKQYLEKEDNNNFIVRLWTVDIKEITGIQENEQFKVASVEYIIHNTDITPFGEVFSDKNQESKRVAQFTLFDDGWRISN